MKKFDELSEHITEEEYRNNGRFHYSDIAGYMKEGFSYLVKPRKEESESLTFGSMVDCIVTEGIDRFNEKYCVEREFNISDNQKAVLKDLSTFRWERLEDIPVQTVTEALGMYYKNPKTQLTKLLEEGGEYYKFILDNTNKIPVDFQMFQDAIDTANVLLTNGTTRQFLVDSQNDDSFDVFHQLKFNGTYNDIPITAMVDCVYIDHETKRIWPIDLKTTCANYEWEFPKSFVKYRYDVQGKLYSLVLRQVMDNDDFYKDYRLMDFVFIYISRTNKNPIVWLFDENMSENDIEFTSKNGTRILLEDFRKSLSDMYEIQLQNRKTPLNISTVNDIMEHLKDF